MLSFFPQDVLDAIWDLLSQFLKVVLPTLNQLKFSDCSEYIAGAN